ncbi:MAG TPA: hypothetical protein VGQ42_07635 [Candidatus Dormibacteraeota bacterium]|jgi:hypothetical protein|nr:hypothetical protein [Candidatus Dormibacteraeota bacterium]
MKYMIMMFAGAGASMENRPPEWMARMGEFMMKLDGELRERGELVSGGRLADPSRARTIRF